MKKQLCHHKGIIGEAKIALRGIELGFEILKPMNPHAPFDLIFNKNNQYYKVQCKYVSIDKKLKRYDIPFASSTKDKNGKRIYIPYKIKDVDLLAAYLKEDDKVVFIKNKSEENTRKIVLRPSNYIKNKYYGGKPHRIEEFINFPE